jgi:tetratricopeptide (TPR) repeat protein
VSTNPNKPIVAQGTDIVIHHFGKAGDPDTLRQKMDRYLKLGLLKANENPTDAKGWYELGVQYHELGRFEECIEPLLRAFDLEPLYSNSLYFAANAHFKLGHHDQARPLLERLLKIKPDHADALVNLAEIEKGLGRAESALDLYEIAIESAPSHFAAWFNRGAILLKRGQYAKATRSLHKAVELYPGYTPALFGLWQSMILDGRHNEAGALVLEYRTDSQELVSMITSAAQNSASSGDYTSVIEALKPLAKSMDEAMIWSILGAAQFGMGQIEAAKVSLTRAVEKNNDDIDARINLAQLYENYLNDKKQAIEYYRQAQKIEPENKLCKERISSLTSY